MSLTTQRYDSFLVRVQSHAGRFVQGEITHVETRQTARFRRPDGVVTFILERLRPADQPNDQSPQ